MTVRTARKEWRCENAHAHSIGHPAVASCRVNITPGEQYVEGQRDPYLAGGFGFEKYCMACLEAGQAITS